MEKTCFTRISDLHLSDPRAVTVRELFSKRLFGYLSWLKNRRHEHLPAVLETLVLCLQSGDSGPVLITGDMTQIGLSSEFEQALDFLRSLGSPEQIFLVPGNHDSYVQSPIQETYELWQDYLGGLKTRSAGPRINQVENVEFIGLDTAVPSGFFQATGRIGSEQLANLERLLDVDHEQEHFRVLYLHHPPQQESQSWRKRLVDGGDLLRLIADRPVELILHGHEHQSHLTEVRSCGRLIPVLGISSASALGRKDPLRRAAFHQHQVERDGGDWRLKVSEQRYDPGTKSFQVVEAWEFTIPIVSASAHRGS